MGPVVWALTEFAYQINDMKPLANPFQLQSAPGAAQVFGTLNTVAPFGAPVKFDITKAAANGYVTINSQGVYTYTPSAALAASGGTDTFTVTATDAGQHLENLLGLQGHATTMVVSVKVAAPAADERVTAASQSEGPVAYADSRPTVLNTYTVFNNSWATQNFGNVVSLQGMWDTYPGVGAPMQTGDQYQYTYTQYSNGPDAAPQSTWIQQQLVSNGGVDSGVPGTLAWNPNAPLFIGDNVTYPGYYLQTYNVTCQPSAGACYAPPTTYDSTTYTGTQCNTGSGGSEGTSCGTIWLNDAPGTIYHVPASEAQQQSDILQRLVFFNDQNQAVNATFYPQSQPTVGYTNALKVQGFEPYTNNTQDDSTNTYTVSQTTTKTNSTDFSVETSVSGAGALGELGVEASETITKTYGTEQESSVTYQQDVTQTVEPGYTLYLYTQTPVQRFYGDWKVTYGNTTYILDDVWYDTPYPVTGQYSAYLTAYTCQEGSSECAQLAAGYVPESYPSPIPTGSANYPVAQTPSSSNTGASRTARLSRGRV